LDSSFPRKKSSVPWCANLVEELEGAVGISVGNAFRVLHGGHDAGIQQSAPAGIMEGNLVVVSRVELEDKTKSISFIP
jgi:hypothetical protein